MTSYENDSFVLKGITEFRNKELGRGAYGKVYVVKYCKMTCAAKEIHGILVEDVGEIERARTIQSFVVECRQCSKLRHPNIVQFLGIYYPTGADGATNKMRLPVMVMEMMLDSLTSFVKKPDIPIRIKYSIVHDVSLGLCYLHHHDPPIVHRDLSPNNVLLTTHYVAKISDLGVAKVIKADSKKTMTKVPGTVDFMPPEALKNSPVYGPPMDVFSFAGIILHTFNQEWPNPIDPVYFNPKTRKQKALSEIERRQQHLDKMTREAKELRPLVEECLDYDPAVRPNIETVSDRIETSKDACKEESPLDYIALYQQNRQLKIENKELKIENKELQGKNRQLQTTLEQIQSTKEPLPIMQALASSSHYIKWKQLADLSVPLYYAHAVVRNRKIYVTGQSPVEGMEHQVFVLDITSNRWYRLPQSGHSFGILHVIGDRLTVVGGRWAAANQRTNKVSTFDDDKQVWVSFYPDMLSARNRPGVVSHLEHVIVAGGTTTGHNDASVVLNDIEVFNWKENSHWRRVSAKLPAPMYGFMPTVSNGHMLIVGYSDADKKRDRSAYKIPIANIVPDHSHQNRTTSAKWSELTIASHWGATLVPNSSPPMIAGGEDTTNATTENIQVYDYSSKTWKNSKLLNTARSYAAVAVVSDIGIVVIGGCAKGGSGANWNMSSMKLVELGQAELHT